MTKTNFLNNLTQLGKKIIPSGSHLWLYGSQARGDANEDSDWDLLVLLDKEQHAWDDFDNYAIPFIDLGLNANTIVNPFIYTLKEWKERQHAPFQQNVEADKVILV